MHTRVRRRAEIQNQKLLARRAIPRRGTFVFPGRYLDGEIVSALGEIEIVARQHRDVSPPPRRFPQFPRSGDDADTTERSGSLGHARARARR